MGSCKLLIARSHFLGESRLSLVACSPFDHDLHEEHYEDDDEEHDEEHDDEDDDEDHNHDDDGAFFKALRDIDYDNNCEKCGDINGGVIEY